MRLRIYILLLVPLLISACDQPDPEQRRIALHLPPVGFKGDAEQGRAEFEQYCAACHGQDGLGTQQGPPLIHQTYSPGHHADLAFHMAVRDGVRSHHWVFGDMQPVQDVSPEATQHIIAYVRREQRKAGIQ